MPSSRKTSRKSDPFLGRSLVERPSLPAVRGTWKGETTELHHEFGDDKIRRVIAGRDNIGGRRIA